MYIDDSLMHQSLFECQVRSIVHSFGAPPLNEILAAILRSRDIHLLYSWFGRVLVVDLKSGQSLDVSLVVVLKLFGAVVDSFWISWSDNALLNFNVQPAVDFMFHFTTNKI